MLSFIVLIKFLKISLFSYFCKFRMVLHDWQETGMGFENANKISLCCNNTWYAFIVFEGDPIAKRKKETEPFQFIFQLHFSLEEYERYYGSNRYLSQVRLCMCVLIKTTITCYMMLMLRQEAICSRDNHITSQSYDNI